MTCPQFRKKTVYLQQYVSTTSWIWYSLLSYAQINAIILPWMIGMIECFLFKFKISSNGKRKRKTETVSVSGPISALKRKWFPFQNGNGNGKRKTETDLHSCAYTLIMLLLILHCQPASCCLYSIYNYSSMRRYCVQKINRPLPLQNRRQNWWNPWSL